MKRIATEINGITSSAVYKEGDCAELVNLRKRNGVLQPVTPRKVMREFGYVYDLLFVHRNSGYEHWLGVRDGILYWIQNDNTEVLITTVGADVSITQIGHVLNIVDANGVKYALWHTDSYKMIDLSHKNLPKVELKTECEHRSVDPVDRIPNTNDGRMGLLNKAFAEEKEKGHLYGYTMACTAYELYDGSIVFHSEPVLLGMANDKHTRLADVEIAGNKYSYKGYWNSVFYGLPSETASTPVWEYKAYIKKDTYTTLADRANFGLTTSWNSAYTDGRVQCWGELDFYKLRYKVGADIPALMADVIKSVNVYLTKEVSLYDFEKDLDALRSKEEYRDNNLQSYNELFRPAMRELPDVIAELGKSNFYKVCEIPFADIVEGNWIDIDLQDRLGDKLYNLDMLPVDASSWHSFRPKQQFVYNSKLHVFDYEMSFFDGWGLDRFQKEVSGGEFEPKKHTLNDSSTGSLIGSIPYWILVDLKTDSGNVRVVREGELRQGSVLDLPAVLSYPDRRAYRMTIMLGKGKNQHENDRKVFDLTAHDYQNIAYYISPDLKPIRLQLQHTNWVNTPLAMNNVEAWLNSVKVSGVNNPFYFPNETVYQISNGRIIAMATNAMNVSDRNFGQYPVFVATTDGWFMLSVGDGNVGYGRVVPVTAGEIPTSSVLCSTPYGVVFVSYRGLYAISANGCALLSPQLEEKGRALDFEENGHTAGMLGFDNDFGSFVQGAGDIVYNPHENELIVTNDGFDFNWVLDVSDKSFYKSTEGMGVVVDNVYPDLLVADGKDVKTFALSGADMARVSFRTRPLGYGSLDLKHLKRVFLRGLLYVSNESVQVLWRSDDEVRFKILRGLMLRNGNFRDVDMGLMGRTKWRWFAVGFGGSIHADTRIRYIEAMVAGEWRNEKMR